MAVRFVARCLPAHVAFSLVATAGLLRKDRALGREEWTSAPEAVAGDVRRLLPLVEEGEAVWHGHELHVPNAVAVEMPESTASRLGMPRLAPVLIDVAFHGTIGDPGCHVGLEWRETSYRQITPTRTGIQLRWGGLVARLGAPLYTLVEAIDRFNAVAGGDMEARVARWIGIQNALDRVDPEVVKRDQYTKGLTLFQAGSFGLDVKQSPAGIDFHPVLMSGDASGTLDDNAPANDGEEGEYVDAGLADANAVRLLMAEDQRTFLKDFEQAGERTRKAYALRRQTFLVVDDQLRVALDVVRAMRGASDEDKRTFVKNPRVAIAAALGIEGGSDVLTSLFVETKQYSDRVTGLGVWTRPELTWLSKTTTAWLPERFPIVIDGKETEVSRDDLKTLLIDVEHALAVGEGSVPFRGGRIGLDEAIRMIKAAGIDVEPPPGPISDPEEAEPVAVSRPSPQGTPVVVQIGTNFDGADYEAVLAPRRAAIPPTMPHERMGRSLPKPHQEEGFAWLVDAWTKGWPGVLLADDMGLGKSFQALAFLAWVKENEAATSATGRSVRKGPILIVAPTALLENWIVEAGKHLAPDALGRDRADVFGAKIRRFKGGDADHAPSEETLDWRKIGDHDWVLTTYETLADNHVSFAKVRFSVALFDEMQKVKDPGTLNTWAAKTVNADFVLGLTGTPVENRMEDLWSIMDRVSPGLLGDLRSFSSRYRDGTPETYRTLSDGLMKPVGGAPAVVLRRMKDDILTGLPSKTVVPYRTEMPAVQASAYADVVAAAVSSAANRGAMLEAVQRLRGISLFPGNADGLDLATLSGCEEWMSRSARLSTTFDILRDLERRAEKALIFVEHRSMQAMFAEAFMTLFRMERPLSINGATPGHKRQRLVEQFQARRRGFDLMVLSPKAAGIGLTITAANHVIHLSRWWNPAVEDQCNDRVYRIGQERPVTIHVPMAVHPSIADRSFDVTLDDMLERKRRMSKNLLAPPVSESDLKDFADIALAA